MNGKVKAKSSDRGFLFIAGEDGGDYFAHRSDFPNDAFDLIVEGDAVTFTAVTPPPVKGKRAANVFPAGAEPKVGLTSFATIESREKEEANG